MGLKKEGQEYWKYGTLATEPSTIHDKRQHSNFLVLSFYSLPISPFPHFATLRSFLLFEHKKYGADDHREGHSVVPLEAFF